jgi:hypothetical protein
VPRSRSAMANSIHFILVRNYYEPPRPGNSEDSLREHTGLGLPADQPCSDLTRMRLKLKKLIPIDSFANIYT